MTTDFNALAEIETKSIELRESFDFLDFQLAKHSNFRKKSIQFKNSRHINFTIFDDSTNYKNASRLTNNGLEINRTSINLAESKDTDSILIIACTTNDLAKQDVGRLMTLLSKSSETILVVQDYDNHHWFRMSGTALQVADVYIPAHEYNLHLIRRLCHHPVKSVPAGSIQWSKQTLLAHNDAIKNTTRKHELSGKHVFYPQFSNRNRVIATFAKASHSVGFIQHSDYHQMSEEVRLRDWLSAKTHLICPTTLDIPIRFFDSLITGGLPIVPLALLPSLELLQIPTNFFNTYTLEDLLNPLDAQARWNNDFDKLGLAGILDRHLFAMNYFHIDRILEQQFTICTHLMTQPL